MRALRISGRSDVRTTSDAEGRYRLVGMPGGAGNVITVHPGPGRPYLGAVAEVPGGAHPSYAQGYSVRDNDFYLAWDEISRDRDTFEHWMEENVVQVTPAPATQGSTR